MSISYLKEYNNKLIKTNEEILIDTYFLNILDNDNVDSNKVDKAFAKLYLTLINHEDEFFIDGSILYKYGVIRSNTLSDIRDLLLSYNAVEDVDYIIDYQIEFNQDSTIITSKNYILTPKIFKILLVSSKQITEYYNPYIEYIYILKRMECYYYKYIVSIKENDIKKKNDYISKLIKESKKVKSDLIEIESQYRLFKKTLVDKVNLINKSEISQPSTNENVIIVQPDEQESVSQEL